MNHIILIRKCFFTSAYFSPFDLKSSLNQKLLSLKTKVCFYDWQISGSIFSNVISHEQVTNATKIWIGYKVNLLLIQKWDENIPKFYFYIPAHTFSTHMPNPFKICFTNKVNTICGGGQLLVTGSQGPITRTLVVRISCPRVASPKAQGLTSQGHGFPGPRISGLRVPGLMVPGSQGTGSRVSGPDFRLCRAKQLMNY